VSRRQGLPWWVRVVAIYLASRFAVLLGVLFAALIAPPLRASDWTLRWDSFWYLNTAEHGYPPNLNPLSPERPYNANSFFPLWPLLVRAVTALTGHHVILAAYLTNAVLGGVLALLIWRLFRRFTDEPTADLSVALFLFFPGTNVFSAAYSEPLALCLAVLALHALLDERWIAAGVWCALAGATRPPVALAVTAAAVWAVVSACRRGRWRSIVSLLLAPLGLLGFALFQWRRTGDLLAFHTAEDRLFAHRLDGGVSFVRVVVRQALENTRSHQAGLAVSVLIGTCLLVALAVVFVRDPPDRLLVVYTVAVLLPVVLDSALLPKVRFVAAAFPLFLPLAGRLRPLAAGLVLGLEGTLLAGFTVINLVAWLAFP
jgi:hypothetical protein